MNNVFDAMAWAIRVSRGEPMAARMLLIIGLAQRVRNDDEDFLVWPSINQIAHDTDMSRTSIKKWMRHLEEKGFVQRYEVKRENRTNSSNRYKLAVRSDHYHPTKGLMPDDDETGRNPTGIGRETTGDGSVGSTGTGRTARPPIELPEELPKEPLDSTPPNDGELPLGLKPIPPKEVTPLELAAFIASEWVTRAHATPLRGGRPSEANIEKAMKLARAGAVDGQSPIDVWRDIFKEIDLSDFLQGKVPGKDGRPPFRLTLSFLLEKRNFDKTLEGRFGGQSTGERRLGSTSQATGDFLDSLRSSQARRAGGGGQGRSRAIARN